MTYTLHHRPSQTDLRGTGEFSKYILDNSDNRKSRRSDKLLIDSRCYTNEIPIIIGLDAGNSWRRWTSVKHLKWRDGECPLPEGKELVFYDLGKEQKGKREENEWTFTDAHM